MQQLGFRSVFAKLFASVMLALTLFAVAMVLLTQLVHDKDASIRSKVLATQILGQIDPFLNELNVSISNDNRLQARFMLAVVKKSFDIFDESLQAKMGLYDNDGRLLMQTDNSDLPLELPAPPSLLMRAFPSFADSPPTQQAQVYSSTGYTLLYESRLPPKKPVLSAALNLFTGTLLLLIIMAGVLWWIARNMTWRLNQMSQQMAQLGDGDFSVRVNARGNDEITSLARGFNQAAQKIEHLIDANNLLLAHASHELRTPITRIRLQIEMMDMLASGMPPDTKAKFDKRAQAVNRDLSGLNDLVESILLVSRLDAGHAVQQIERLDLYDVVNQERQHYPEATLIGKHITIDGQASMLTHLIRNLLTNAMLHGTPPITVLLYGVQTLEQADTVPDYLLQGIMNSSFADHNLSDLAYYDELKSDETIEGSVADTTHADEQTLDTKSVDLPVPIIYKNGESLILDDKKNIAPEPSINDDLESITDAQLSASDRPPASALASLMPKKSENKEIENGENAALPRKEGLFKKHLNKPKADLAEPVAKYAVLAIIDEGSGIPKDKRKEIFSPFVRLQQKQKGSGLGLSLVAQIVTAHQGYIKTDTINGHTRFLVVLPVQHNPDYDFHDHDSHL
ncbi:MULTISPECIES: ATP-binding protein [unclassified Psychrobacter]|uniref:ATP-binding protein n=1 Tax=unclassified Psychrobacter TaxID=196806 RepID=UPI003FCF920B